MGMSERSFGLEPTVAQLHLTWLTIRPLDSAETFEQAIARLPCLAAVVRMAAIELHQLRPPRLPRAPHEPHFDWRGFARERARQRRTPPVQTPAPPDLFA